MVDDMIDTAGTACSAISLLKDQGAREIYFFACHGLLSKNALERINNSRLTKLIVTNTIPHKKEVLENNKIDIIDVSWLCAQSIYRHLNGISISELYNEKTFNEKVKEIEFI